MSQLLHRNLDAQLPVIVGADGNYLIDGDGKRYLDACGGAAVSCLGHSDKRVQDAICAQVRAVPFAHTGFFTNEPAEELASVLMARAPEGTGDGKVMFLGSGSEAMEAALKLVRQYHLERGDEERRHIIARRFSYHGNTLGALSVGGHKARRAPFEPYLFEISHIDPCYSYRYRRDAETEADFARRMAGQLEDRIIQLGSESVAAFIAEPVVGATLGSQPAASGYFRHIREICDRYGILFVADEVMCGMGRTGTEFALEQEGVAADITTFAKGLGAGYQPIAAVVAAEKVCAALLGGSGRLWNGHTYMAHAVACAGALAVRRAVEESALLENVRTTGKTLAEHLHRSFGQHEHVGDIRGRGLFWSLEFVRDRTDKVPFAQRELIAPKLGRAALAAGVMCYPSQGCADGIDGDHVLLAPAYTTTEAEIDEMVSGMKAALDSVFRATA